MIKVLFFAHLQEEIGKSEIELDNADMSVKKLKTDLQEKYNLSNMDQVMVAINEEFAVDDDEIKDGDVVAFIPPVSGG